MKKILSIGALLLVFFSGCMKAEKISFDASTPSGSIFSLVVGAASAAAGAGTGTSTGTAVTYTISGTIFGYTGSGLVLQNNAGDNLAPASGATTFSFATKVADKGAYSVTVSTQPTSTTPPLNCTVAGGSGTIAGANITGVSVTCAYAGAQFVAVGDSGNAWWSNDGMNWTATSYTYGAYASAKMKSVAFSGSKWVAVGEKGNAGAVCAVWSSDDGKIWTQGICLAGILPLTGVTYGNGMFLAGGNHNTSLSALLMKSTDGVNWTSATSLSTTCTSACSPMSSVVFEPTSKTFVVHYPSSGLYKTSDGGGSWSLFTGLTGFNYIRSIFPGPNSSSKITVLGYNTSGNYTTALGNPTTNSWDAQTGTMVTGTFPQNAVVYGKGMYVDVGNLCNSYYYNTTWVSATVPAACGSSGYGYNLLSVNYHSKLNLFVSGGLSSNPGQVGFIYSSSGSAWNLGNSFTSTSPVNAIGVAE